MTLYKFTLKYSNDRTEYYFKFCKYPKKTKLYKQCMDMLNNDKLHRFSYGQTDLIKEIITKA